MSGSPLQIRLILINSSQLLSFCMSCVFLLFFYRSFFHFRITHHKFHANPPAHSSIVYHCRCNFFLMLHALILFLLFFTRGHRVALSTDTMCTICIVFTCSTTATLFNYLIYLTSRKKRPTPSPPWNIEQSVKGGKNCVFGQHCRAQLKMVIGWSSISVLRMESVQYNS